MNHNRLISRILGVFILGGISLLGGCQLLEIPNAIIQSQPDTEILINQSDFENVANLAFQNFLHNIDPRLANPMVAISCEYNLLGLDSQKKIDRAWFQDYVSTKLVSASGKFTNKSIITPDDLTRVGVTNAGALATPAGREALDKLMSDHGTTRPYDHIIIATLSSDCPFDPSNTNGKPVNVTCSFKMLTIDATNREVPSGQATAPIEVKNNKPGKAVMDAVTHPSAR